MPTLFRQYMFDRGKFAAIDYAASSAFFRKALEPLGGTGGADWRPSGVEHSQPEDKF